MHSLSSPNSVAFKLPMLEREQQLGMLHSAHHKVVQGDCGMCALVSGEAGIGKTTLTQAFVQSLSEHVTVLLSYCEALLVPRPLGPLADIAQSFPQSIAQTLQQGTTYNGIFPELLQFFKNSAQPVVWVVEDVHWADAGTLDLLRYLGRRLGDVPLMLLLTHRDEGLHDNHPLQTLLGDLPMATTVRTMLPSLSAEAVATLARAAQRDPAHIFATTDGNPFYVTEILAAPDSDMPPSIRDAMRSTLARLPAPARTLAQWVSMFPGRAERSTLDQLAAPNTQDLEDCLHSGLLQAVGSAWMFRHELARLAVYDSLESHRRDAWHLAIFNVLQKDADAHTSLEPLVHHAQAAHLGDKVARLAPPAALAAATRGAHRESARLYALALQYGCVTDTAQRAQWFEALAHACVLTNQRDQSLHARQQALALHTALGNTLAIGTNQRWMARLHWLLGDTQGNALQCAEQAIATLEQLTEHRELAAAYSTLSHLHLVSDNLALAQQWGQRAIDLAQKLHAPEVHSHALTNVATARLRLHHDDEAWEMLQDSLQLALEHGLDTDAARAMHNLFVLSVMQQNYPRGLAYAAQGIAYSESKGLDIFTVRIYIWRAYTLIQMGLWDKADEDLAYLAGRHHPAPMEAATLKFVQTLLELRRGVDASPAKLTQALHSMERYHMELWLISAAAVLAEVACMEGRFHTIDAIVRPALLRLAAQGDCWHTGEVAMWLPHGGGQIDMDLPELPPTYALQISGQWRAAADQWQTLGCPYQAGLVLCAGDESALREALVIFDALGALPAAKRARQMLHSLGARDVPRGPQPRTKRDPLGLTAHEREVFELLRQGLGNAEIAQRMHRSVRTVEHHVAAVFQKLDVHTRPQLMARYPLAQHGIQK